MKHINITPGDIVNCMSEDTKHSFAIGCLVYQTDPDEVLEKISRIITNYINFSIDVCNSFLESPAGKEYLNMRKKIDNIGGNTR